jgi:hypothetical protein
MFRVAILLAVIMGLPALLMAQSPNTSLGSSTVQQAMQRVSVPQTGDIMMLYRGQNGDAVYSQSLAFMFAVSAANTQANFGGP